MGEMKILEIQIGFLVVVSLEFFDLQALQDEGLWEGVKLGINAECARSYKDRKQKAKSIF
ncbi:hypothetical protein R6Q59_010261 [Mikania micrantha]